MHSRLFNLTEIPILNSIENSDSKLKQDASAFTFRKTLLKLNGKNFQSSNIQIRIYNEKFSRIFKNGIKFIASDLIEFESPPLEQYNFSSSFRFPTSFKLGISFNEGNDYTEQNFVFIDKYASLYLYQVNPSTFPKNNISLSLQGIGFEFASSCLFKNGMNTILETNATILSSTIVQCDLNANVLSSVSLLSVFVINQFNDSSNGFDVNVYGKIFYFNFFRHSKNI
jgi:hypothetical protein